MLYIAAGLANKTEVKQHTRRRTRADCHEKQKVPSIVQRFKTLKSAVLFSWRR